MKKKNALGLIVSAYFKKEGVRYRPRALKSA